MTKEIYLIRHAQSEANAALDLDNPTFYYDARITSVGKEQALSVQKKLKNIDFDLMLCSPLTRTLQTFSLIFPTPINNTIILPLIREHLDHSCDVGRQPSILQKEFSHLNFDDVNKFWWNNDKYIHEKKINYESIEDLDKRVMRFKKWIQKRSENKIALVSHGTFISRIIHFFLDNCEFEIWYPDNG
jgi:broad specificity phosphatase PhoE